MKREQILNLIRGLAGSTGFYGRLYCDIMSLTEEHRDEYLSHLESLNFSSDLDVVLYLEEGKLPEDYQRPALTDSQIKKAVTEQLIGMFDNNIIRQCGVESFRNWLEDGEVFFNNGMTEAEIDKAMEYADQLEGAVEKINQILGED